MPSSSKKKPLVIVTRKLPDAIETRLMELFDTRLNALDKPLSSTELVEAMKAADVLVPTVTDRIDSRVLSQAGPRLKLIASKAANLHKTPATSAEVVAKLEPEVMGEIRSCAGDWCRVRVSGVSGWIERTGMWGVYKSEPIN